MATHEVIELDSDDDDYAPAQVELPTVTKQETHVGDSDAETDKYSEPGSSDTDDDSSVIVLDSETSSDTDSDIVGVQNHIQTKPEMNGNGKHKSNPQSEDKPKDDPDGHEHEPSEEPMEVAGDTVPVQTVTLNARPRRVTPVPLPSLTQQPRPGPSSRCRPSSVSPKSRRNGNTPNTIALVPPERRARLESQLVQLMRKVDEVDEREVDWDDEQNSAYLQKSRMTVSLLKHYELLATAFGENGALTGRPMQKVFTVTEVTKYPEIDSAVAKFLNKYCKPRVRDKQEVAYATPEYADVYDVVAKTIKDKRLTVVPGEVDRMAQDLFKYTVKVYKARRAKELKIALPDLFERASEANDPAEHDPELKRKLEQNVKLRRTEEEVLREFVQKENEFREVEEGEESEDEDSDDDVDLGEGAQKKKQRVL